MSRKTQRYSKEFKAEAVRTVPAFNWQPVISLIFIASSSVLQRERW
ncbi:IS600 ORF1 [Shigella sonnei]|nr:IS600 ORF1 [Shigella sonnei]